MTATPGSTVRALTTAAPVATVDASPAPAEVPAPAIEEAPAEEPPAEPPKPRITSIDYVTWIWPAPRVNQPFLGYIRVGEAVPLKTENKVQGPGCAGGFYAVEPRGYVCNDRTVSRAPDAVFLSEIEATRGGSGPLPYRYAISNGSPMYARLPTSEEQQRFERPYGPAGRHAPLSKYLRSHEDLAIEEPILAKDPVPPHLLPDSGRARPLDLIKDVIPLGSMLSFTRVFDLDGRSFLLSADGSLVPADRTRPFRASTFQGTKLGEGVSLPLGWVRKKPQPLYRRLASGDFEPTGVELPVRTYVAIGEERVVINGRAFLAIKGSPGAEVAYVKEGDLTLAKALNKRPAGVLPGQKWVIVRITDGTLVAYEDMTPVYATLISPGSGGPPVGGDHVKNSTTPTGTYYVTFKDKAATMSPEKGKGRSFWIADVPHTQYFHPPFALHAAYWHERFGEPTSAGCVNLSPIDAEVLFDWSDPPVPPGWQGVTGAGATQYNGPTTAVVVRR